MKQVISFWILLIFPTILFAQNATFAGGSGTSSDPYIISTPQHLDNMYYADYGSDPANPLARYFKLNADLDMTGFNWIPTNSASPYNRLIHLDGNGHIIKNLTCKGQAYASLLGVVCGSVRNLGLVNVDILSTNAGGAFGGYVGSRQPAAAWGTGVIENCYVTGVIDGQVAVGGIAGNIGKPSSDNQTASAVRNCYSTADVKVTNAGEGRAGGIVGIIWDKGQIEMCYATGTITSYSAAGRSGAGGIAGYSDSDLKGCVALNDSVINAASDQSLFLGRLVAILGGYTTAAPAVQSGAWEGSVLYNYNYTLSPSEMITDVAKIEKYKPFDGESKTSEYLSDPMNWFMNFGYDMASDEPVWSQTLHNGRPIFQWLTERSDYESIDGHENAPTGITDNVANKLAIETSSDFIKVTSNNLIDAIKIYSSTGQLIYNGKHHSGQANIPFENKGIFIISVNSNGTWQSKKAVLN